MNTFSHANKTFAHVYNVVGGMLTKCKNLHGILENKMPALANI
jgi:hypothetical protein